MKPTDNYMLALTFVDEFDFDRYELISANVGKIINNQFVLAKSLKINKIYADGDVTFETESFGYSLGKDQINKFQAYLKDRWNNKGLMLMDIRSKEIINKRLCNILVEAHKHFGDKISSIVCGIAPKEEFIAYKKLINGIVEEENNNIKQI